MFDDQFEGMYMMPTSTNSLSSGFVQIHGFLNINKTTWVENGHNTNLNSLNLKLKKDIKPLFGYIKQVN